MCDDDSIPLTTSNALTTMSSDTKHGYIYNNYIYI